MVYIVLINYNGFKDTIECVESILNGDSADSHIVIVDNCSTDDSVAQLKQISSDRVTLISAESNLGFSGGNNIGIKYALDHGADYVLLLNNDTIISDNFLSPMLNTAAQLNNDVAVTCKIRYFSSPQNIWYAGGDFNWHTSRVSHRGINQPDTGLYDSREFVSFISGCCILLPKKILNDIGLMDESFFLYCEDTEYCLRIAKKGYKMVYEPKGLIYHKVSASTGKTSNLITYYIVRNKQYLIQKYISLYFKPLAYLYVFLENIKRTIQGEYMWVAVKRGFVDFIKGITGELTEKI